MQYMSTIWLDGVASNSRLSPHAPHCTIAGPGPWGSLTRIDSSPQEGQVKTDGSFFFTTLMTRLRRLPNKNHLSETELNAGLFQDCIQGHLSVACRSNTEELICSRAILLEYNSSKKVLSEYKSVSVRAFIRQTVQA
jgi:hypothetical protein